MEWWLIIPAAIIGIIWVTYIFIKARNEYRGPKGEQLTDDIIEAYREQDKLDKESVFDQCKP